MVWWKKIKHKHLLQTARALYFYSKVPEQYWGECVLCAALLINRMPLQSLNYISPYEKLFGDPLDLEYLRVFGWLFYVSTIQVNITKFEPRAQPHVFMGYPPDKKGYKVLNLKTMQIQISRDVVFHEQHFPYHLQNSTTITNPFFLQILFSYRSVRLLK